MSNKSKFCDGKCVKGKAVKIVATCERNDWIRERCARCRRLYEED
jgi:hypothetical protein